MATTPVVYSDLADDFSLNGQGDIKTVTNAEAIKASIRNILGTRKGERPVFPEFGSALYDGLFQTLDQDSANFYAKQVKDDIEAWEGRATVRQVDFNPDAAGHIIGLKIYFTIPGFNQVFDVDVTLGG
jgi:hypothetical protein